MLHISSKGKRYWLNLMLFAFAALFLGFALVLILFGARGAAAYLHPPRWMPVADETPAGYGVDFEDLLLATEDGLSLQAWYTAPQNGAVILVAHGYAAARSAPVHAFFASRGYGVLSWDARAHGGSEGDLTTFGYQEILDVRAALDYVLEEEKVEHVGAYGMSMGGATLLRATANFAEIEALVTDSAYSSLEGMMNRVVPSPLLAPFVRWFAEREAGLSVHALRPVEDIQRISPRPVFIIHGAEDSAVPSQDAETLYAAAGEPRELWIASGAGHVETWGTYPEEYARRMMAFFDAYLLRSAPQPAR